MYALPSERCFKWLLRDRCHLIARLVADAGNRPLYLHTRAGVERASAMVSRWRELVLRERLHAGRATKDSLNRTPLSEFEFEPEAVDNTNSSCQPLGRRQALASSVLLCSAALFVAYTPGKLLAEEVTKGNVDKDQGIIGELLSVFDPDETTKLGKKLPKAYLKSARDVVKSLRDSFSEKSDNDAKFRRKADSAKEAIREYISSWRGAENVATEESYQALERALRALSEFYSKMGPRAVLSEDVRVRILEDLQNADDAL